MYRNEPTIIIVNKVGTLRRVTVWALKYIGLTNVIETSSEREALNHLPYVSGDIIIIHELIVPKKGDLSFAEVLKKFSKYKSISAILTAHVASRDIVLDAIALGYSDLVIKNYDLDAFTDKMERAIGNLYRVESYA